MKRGNVDASNKEKCEEQNKKLQKVETKGGSQIHFG